MINNKTKLYLSCSSKPGNFGATLYNRLFEKNNMNAVYIPRYCIQEKELIESIKLLKCSGCSISMPLKNKVIPYLDELSGDAEQSQSVNTIVNKEGYLVGYNTDIFGAQKVLENHEAKDVVIYGSGSVVDSLLIALKSLSVKSISIYSRNLIKAAEKCLQHDVNLVKKKDDLLKEYDLLINATPANFDGDLKFIADRSNSVFDLVVSTEDTGIIKSAKSQEKEFFSGINMAKHQFQKQFEVYTGLVVNLVDIENIIKG